MTKPYKPENYTSVAPYLVVLDADDAIRFMREVFDYLACAVAGKADYLVTGDKKHLLPLGSFCGIPIVTPAAFLIAITL